MTFEMWACVVHASAALLMAGLCWCVQIVHYPMFARVAQAELSDAAREHAARITWFVAPVMLAELLGACAVLVLAHARHPDAVPLAWVGAVLLLFVWASTFGRMVPLHARLARTGDPRVVPVLVRANLPRTLAWTARGAASMALLLLMA